MRRLLWLALAIPSLLAAQEPPVTVRFEPLRQEWQWQDWASGLCGDFESALNRRYREGLPRREFTDDSKPARLVYILRMDPQGRILRFVPLSPEHRYLDYLVRHTAREIAPDLDSPPRDLPYPTVEGRLTFELRFRPTGFYKRHYFEEPLDSLDLPQSEPLLKSADAQPLYLYEPPDLDKNKLLEEFRKRIGLGAAITDTSLYAPLEVSGMYLALSLPYDSLRSGIMDTLRLRRQMTAALEKAGAHVLDQVPVEAYSSAPSAAPDSSAQDSLNREVATVEVSEAKSNPEAVADSAMPSVDLPLVFSKIVNLKRTLVLSAGLARDSLPGKALCRVRLFEPSRPEDFKRSLDYVFKYQGELPDTLGELLVERLVHPPAKPEPPKPKEPPAAKTDSTAKAAPSDSTAKADSTGAKPAAANPAAPGAAKADSAAASTTAPAKAAPADSASKAPASAPAVAPPDSAAKAPSQAPPAAAPSAPPADTAKSTAAPQAAAAQPQAQAPPPAQAAPAAAADSAKSQTGPQ